MKLKKIHRSIGGSRKISVKWKVFMYLLGFTAVLLGIQWMFQICYLDTFYKKIKMQEADRAMEAAIEILETDGGQNQEELEALASAGHLSVLAADGQGNVRSKVVSFPELLPELFLQQELVSYYRAAQEKGGSVKFVFEEGQRPQVPNKEEPRIPETEEPQLPETERSQLPETEEPQLPETEQSQLPETEQPQLPETERLQTAKERIFSPEHRQTPAECILYVKLFTKEGETLAAFVYSALTPVDATVTTLKTQLFWMSILLIFLSLGLAFLISGKMTKSLVGINASARELAKGNYKISFSDGDYREIAELSDTLNYAARELLKTEELRRELIANVSHDLRTPLTMIIAYAEGMRDLPGENTPENIQVVIEEAQRLTELVNDMLDLSKLQAGVLEKEAAVYNLTESIRGVLRRYNKLVEQEGYCITFDYEQEIYVEADEFKIFQVVYNLVNNGIHYTGEDKRVLVRQIPKGDKVRIEVEDSGQGIPKEELPFVWERYYKGKKAHKRAAAGTGLGLSIVKNILLLHQADYGVESQPGGGSIFWFELKTVPLSV